MSRDRLRLLHIRDAIDRIRSYASNDSQFFDDSLVQDAVIRNLEVIGEAVRSLAAETTDRRPDLPWAQIAAMRNRLIHGYFTVDLQLVWDVVAHDLEPLRNAVTDLLAEDKESQTDLGKERS